MKNLLLILTLISILSCNQKTIDKQHVQTKSVSPSIPENDVPSQEDIDNQIILEWLVANDLEMESTPEGIFYKMLKEGVGVAHPTALTKVTTHYEGKLLDGTKFDSSYDRGEPISFKLGRVIQGWQIGIPLLKKGGKATFVIPSHLAYGKRSQNKIPANSILVFDVELIDFE